jgi:hypothetical protein
VSRPTGRSTSLRRHARRSLAHWLVSHGDFTNRGRGAIAIDLECGLDLSSSNNPRRRRVQRQTGGRAGNEQRGISLVVRTASVRRGMRYARLLWWPSCPACKMSFLLWHCRHCAIS